MRSLSVNKVSARGVMTPPPPPQSLSYERRFGEPSARGVQPEIDSTAATMVASFLATQQVVARCVFCIRFVVVIVVVVITRWGEGKGG